MVLNFWAGLCPPCRAEMPEFQAFANEYEGRALVLGVDLGQFFALGSEEDAVTLLNELGVTYPAGATGDANVVRELEVLGLPATFFIAADGSLHRKWQVCPERRQTCGNHRRDAGTVGRHGGNGMADNTITFGCNLSVDNFWDLPEFAKRAEDLGFDRVAIGEHVMDGQPAASHGDGIAGHGGGGGSDHAAAGAHGHRDRAAIPSGDAGQTGGNG